MLSIILLILKICFYGSLFMLIVHQYCAINKLYDFISILCETMQDVDTGPRRYDEQNTTKSDTI